MTTSSSSGVVLMATRFGSNRDTRLLRIWRRIAMCSTLIAAIAACGSTPPPAPTVAASAMTLATPVASPAASPTLAEMSYEPLPSIDLGLPAASLGPDAPAFPVPAGATLVNAQVTVGHGAGAGRIAAWTSPLGYGATVAHFIGMNDARWTRGGQPATTASSTTITFADSTEVLAAAVVTIRWTDPVRIEVVFRAKATPSPSAASSPGPTVAFRSLPPAATLPDGFPAALVPAGGVLVDAASLAGTYDAIFTAPGAPSTLAAAYQAVLSSLAAEVSIHADGSTTLIDFSTAGGPGEIVLEPGNGGTTVSIEVRP
jgi:hypothetical protein